MELKILTGLNELNARLNSYGFPADEIFTDRLPLKNIISYFNGIKKKRERIEDYTTKLKCGEAIIELLNSDYGSLCEEYKNIYEKKSFYFDWIRDTLTDILESDIEGAKEYIAQIAAGNSGKQEYAISASRILTLPNLCEAAILEPTLKEKVKRSLYKAGLRT